MLIGMEFEVPRTARASQGGFAYHVINRGNGRNDVFHKREDYAAFLNLIGEACERLAMRVCGLCIMTNHFHLVLQPHNDGDLSRWMQWLMTSHVRRYHRHYGTSGHVWQGRFKAFPIEEDEHLLTVLRYVERNALRAGMVERAEDWEYSSLKLRREKQPPEFLSRGPVELPRNWRQLVNKPLTEGELAAVRNSVNRGAPFGSPDWQQATAKQLGLESSLRPRGRPKGRVR